MKYPKIANNIYNRLIKTKSQEQENAKGCKSNIKRVQAIANTSSSFSSQDSPADKAIEKGRIYYFEHRSDYFSMDSVIVLNALKIAVQSALEYERKSTRNAISLSLAKQLEKIEKIIDNSYSGNELCPICEKWFNIWIEELKQKLREE
jgi:hypothetical protein